MLNQTYHPSAIQRLTVSMSNCRDISIWNTAEVFKSDFFLHKPGTSAHFTKSLCVAVWYSVFWQSMDTYSPQNSENNRKTSKPMCFIFFLIMLWVYGKAICIAQQHFRKRGVFFCSGEDSLLDQSTDATEIIVKCQSLLLRVLLWL